MVALHVHVINMMRVTLCSGFKKYQHPTKSGGYFTQRGRLIFLSVDYK